MHEVRTHLITNEIQLRPRGGEMLEITEKGSKAVQLFSAPDREIPPGAPDLSRVI